MSDWQKQWGTFQGVLWRSDADRNDGYSIATHLPDFERQFGMLLFDECQRDPDAAAG